MLIKNDEKTKTSKGMNQGAAEPAAETNGAVDEEDERNSTAYDGHARPDGPQRAPRVHVRWLVESFCCARVLGVGGQRLHNMKMQTGFPDLMAWISRDNGAVYRIVNVIGTAPGVARFAGLFVRALLEEPEEEPSNLMSPGYNLMLLIPHPCMGRIIGRRMSNFKNIEFKSAALLSAEPDKLPDSDDRIVHIYGVADSIHLAVYYICSQLENDLRTGRRRSWVAYTPNNEQLKLYMRRVESPHLFENMAAAAAAAANHPNMHPAVFSQISLPPAAAGAAAHVPPFAPEGSGYPHSALDPQNHAQSPGARSTYSASDHTHSANSAGLGATSSSPRTPKRSAASAASASIHNYLPMRHTRTRSGSQSQSLMQPFMMHSRADSLPVTPLHLLQQQPGQRTQPTLQPPIKQAHQIPNPSAKHQRTLSAGPAVLDPDPIHLPDLTQPLQTAIKNAYDAALMSKKHHLRQFIPIAISVDRKKAACQLIANIHSTTRCFVQHIEEPAMGLEIIGPPEENVLAIYLIHRFTQDLP